MASPDLLTEVDHLAILNRALIPLVTVNENAENKEAIDGLVAEEKTPAKESKE